MDKVRRAYRWLSTGGNVIASILVGGIALLVSVDVFARYVFDAPLPGTFTIVESAMVVIATIGFAFALDQGTHPRATLVTDRLHPRGQRAMLLMAYFVGFIVSAVMAWQLAIAANYSTSVREFVEGLVPVPLYVPKWIFVFAVSLFGLGFLLHFIEGLIMEPRASNPAPQGEGTLEPDPRPES